MIKKQKNQYLFIFILLAVTALIYLYWFPQNNLLKKAMEAPTKVLKPIMGTKEDLPPPPYDEAPVVNGRRVIGLGPDQDEEDVKDLSLTNTVSRDWEIALQQNLVRQGGDSLKDSKIEKIDSLIWVQDGTALNVESVVITITDKNGRKIQFRALIDSQTGKVLQTWDQPIIDEAGTKSDTGVSLDPRYFEED